MEECLDQFKIYMIQRRVPKTFLVASFHETLKNGAKCFPGWNGSTALYKLILAQNVQQLLTLHQKLWLINFDTVIAPIFDSLENQFDSITW